MFTREFWKAAGERAVKTVAQTAVGAAGVAPFFNWDFPGIASAALAAGVLSVLTSVGSAAATDGSPSLTGAEVITDTPGKHAED